ncbi:hypothetical protein PV08_10036 [Exophiala spinifera]|uniref:AB hydrolase-1 domain-containing protein n=1 Tax=Exophiala spinifera TaxID=91928 RepID=A0A0D1ZCH0_9EURO|nr:uncharacterized protein PV08_10036 [Exophiala spinifera]KIW10737.1 hypothetical protein PV08_10036 [Exophiala spinifera]
MFDDADLMRRELEHLIAEQAQDVLLVMPSYGGIVGTQAAVGLGKVERQAGYDQRGERGGVVCLLYVCAFIWQKASICENGICVPMNPERIFYQDLPVDDQTKWATHIKPQPLAYQFNPMTKAAYENIPVTYLHCKNDQALPLHIQKFFVERCIAKVETFTCAAGHSPFLSQPDNFVKIVVKISGPA